MEITSAEFVKGIVKPDVLLEEGIPQVAFIGRSNVGKSTLINSLTKKKGLARSSSSPGRTQEINLFLINENIHFLDLPGYGYAKASKVVRAKMKDLINGYLFESLYDQKIVLLIDGKTGPSTLDLEILQLLEEHKKEIIIVINKVDKIKKSFRKKQVDDIKEKIGHHKTILYSSTKNIGREELLNEVIRE